MISKKKQYKALLLDLDGTLLDLDIEKFIPAYIEALSAKFNGFVNRDRFVQYLFRATNKVIQNNDPLKKNETVFYEEFCRLLGLSYKQIKPLEIEFYRDDFPSLSCWGREHPCARLVIEAARRKNLTLVLATNPIFPAAAILQRLSWGGLSEELFDLITTMENMHFCKPNPAYYLEITNIINCLPENCLMAGNDTIEDLSAAEAGLDTFLVEDFILHRSKEEPFSNYRGSLKDLAFFIDSLKD